MRSAALVLLLLAAMPLTAARRRAVPVPAPPQAMYDFSAVEAKLRSFVPSSVDGLTFMIARHGQPLYSLAIGDQTISSVVAIASASKMPSATLVMTLVDEGKLDVDVPVSHYLAGTVTWPADKAAITTRMLLNHTSGIVEAPRCLSEQSTTLKACVQQIADSRLSFTPGTRFSYGGGSYQVAGYVAEVVSGKSWNALFAERIGRPLGLTRFTYTQTANPRVAGGAYSDAGDYLRILQMHLGRGTFNGQRVVAAGSIAVMEQNQIAGLPKGTNPGGTSWPGYSFGWWHTDPALHPGSAGPELSDAGAFGFTPWIDRDLDYTAVLVIQHRTATGTAIWNAIRPLITEQMQKR